MVLRSIKDSVWKLEIGNSKIETCKLKPGTIFPFPHFPVSFTRSLSGPMAQFPLSPFHLSLFAFSPSYRFALSPVSLLTCLSAARPLPPRLPSRGRPPPPSDCTPWPLGRRGRCSCRGTPRSSAPPSTAGRQERGSGLGACQFWILDFRFWIQQPRIVQSRLLTSAFGVLQS